MNYHEWFKKALPMMNAYSPEITCSTCVFCKKDYDRINPELGGAFDPLCCNTCKRVEDIYDLHRDHEATNLEEQFKNEQPNQ